MNDFPQSAANYNAGINAFMDARPATRINSVIRVPLDLSNNNGGGARESYGDFTNSVQECAVGGCPFSYDDLVTSFATRLRGFLAVTSDMVGVELHFGFYTDDSVSVTLFDGNRQAYAIVTRPPTLGSPTWRITNSVTFQQPGLYAVEVLHTQTSGHAALEMSILQGAFTDFERGANQAPIVSLKNAGFTLMTPAMFHQTESGQPSFPDLTQCMQCNRQFVGDPGSNGCAAGSRCNAAALCAVCNTPSFCGNACTPCGAQRPFCESQGTGFECAQCRQASDCADPGVCHTVACDATKTCAVSTVMDGMGCPGGTCQSGTCVPLDAGTPDAGSEPGGMDGSVPGLDAGSPGTDAGGPQADAGSGPGGSDAGADAGGPQADAGTNPDPGTGLDGGTRPDGGTGGGDMPPDGSDGETGCGCGSGGSSMASIALLGLALLARRLRRSRRDGAGSVGSGVA
jgi:outer membrane exchange protein TraA